MLNISVYNGENKVEVINDYFYFVSGHNCKSLTQVFEEDGQFLIQENGELYHPGIILERGGDRREISYRKEWCVENKNGKTEIFLCIEIEDEFRFDIQGKYFF